jgi:ornithine--oxo-acid transaminase
LAEQAICEKFKYEKVLFMNSGVEAGESAIKLARRWAYNVKGVPDHHARVLFANGNFWGRTIAACGSSDDPERHRRFGPYGGLNFDLVDYNSLA